jgi:hypothetical protein
VLPDELRTNGKLRITVYRERSPRILSFWLHSSGRRNHLQ